MKYRILLSAAAKSQWKKIQKDDIFKETVTTLINQLRTNPFEEPYKPLIGKYRGMLSKRINLQHRLIYTVQGDIVKILSMWDHFT